MMVDHHFTTVDEVGMTTKRVSVKDFRKVCTSISVAEGDILTPSVEENYGSGLHDLQTISLIL